jgi:hypothetical protein
VLRWICGLVATLLAEPYVEPKIGVTAAPEASALKTWNKPG